MVFLARLSSTLPLWAIVIAALVLGNRWLAYSLIGGLGLLAFHEYLKMLDLPGRGSGLMRAVARGCAVGFFIVTFVIFESKGRVDAGFAEIFIVFLLIALLFGVAFFSEVRGRATLGPIAEITFGFLYIIVLFNFVTWILWIDDEGKGHLYVFFCLLVTKFADMGAYLVGTLIGRDKMIPHISPGKTWQGFAGSFVFSLLGGFSVFYIFTSKLPLLTPLHVAVLGVLLTIGAFLGDLAESVVKRSLGKKDSGNVLPGIGGALDLIDSILFTAPVLYFYLAVLKFA